ncbi:MAG TPA: hypothetical protein VIL61_07810 [Nitrospiria bacterium]
MKPGVQRLSGACLFFILGFSASAAFADLPPLFEGELDVCRNVQREVSRGMSFEESLGQFIREYQADDPAMLGSIQRAIIHRAIRLCRYDPSAVVIAAYLAGVPLPLVVGAAEAAGAGHDVITSALVGAGAAASEVREAFVRAEAPPESSVGLFLPPVFEAGNGLGQASPFRP